MSRCFPFPPPGYEKARNDYTDLLIKEKHKEKKQKKDKKEKEKRDRKEKQDKDRSKEKHKDKDKDKGDRKEKPKDKERDSSTDKRKNNEKKPEVKPRNGEKLSSNNAENNSLHLQELAKRIRNEDRASSSSQMVHKVGEIAVPMVVERSKKDEVRNIIGDERKVNGKNDARALEKTFGQQNFPGLVKRVEGIVKLEQKKNVEKSEHKESEDKGEKLRYKEREKVKKSKDKDMGKEEEKKAKAKEIFEPSKDKLKLNEKVVESSKDSLDFRNIKSPPESINSSFASPAEANLGKRKEPERNGFLLDNGSRLNKLPRNSSFKEPGVENGKKLEPYWTTVELTPEPRLGNNQVVVVNKEQKINGPIPSHQPEIGSLKLSKAAKENGGSISKAPHPDTKHLSQILSVPKMEEWCDLDDQEWLFSSTKLQPNKLRIEKTHQVWAEAIQIESLDITARPYVIPY